MWRFRGIFYDFVDGTWFHLQRGILTCIFRSSQHVVGPVQVKKVEIDYSTGINK